MFLFQGCSSDSYVPFAAVDCNWWPIYPAQPSSCCSDHLWLILVSPYLATWSVLCSLLQILKFQIPSSDIYVGISIWIKWKPFFQRVLAAEDDKFGTVCIKLEGNEPPHLQDCASAAGDGPHRQGLCAVSNAVPRLSCPPTPYTVIQKHLALLPWLSSKAMEIIRQILKSVSSSNNVGILLMCL